MTLHHVTLILDEKTFTKLNLLFSMSHRLSDSAMVGFIFLQLLLLLVIFRGKNVYKVKFLCWLAMLMAGCPSIHIA